MIDNALAGSEVVPTPSDQAISDRPLEQAQEAQTPETEAEEAEEVKEGKPEAETAGEKPETAAKKRTASERIQQLQRERNEAEVRAYVAEQSFGHCGGPFSLRKA